MMAFTVTFDRLNKLKICWQRIMKPRQELINPGYQGNIAITRTVLEKWWLFLEIS